jgi:hypothetical protein
MSANNDDAARSRRNDAFVYHGREGEDVPRDVIHVRVHPSVRVICTKAFLWRSWLISVELHDGLEVIEKGAFKECSSLRKILFPPSVRAIKDFAFYNCLVLTTVEIGKWAFARCGLVRINITPSVRAIKYRAFEGSSGLTTAILNDGLKEIRERIFNECCWYPLIYPPPSG